MRILTLFLALLLTLLPESAHFAPSVQEQDVCWEELADMEEEVDADVTRADGAHLQWQC